MKKIVIDVREPEEFAAGHVQGAINFPLTTLDQNISKIKDLTKDNEAIVYCASGNRSAQAISILERQGVTNLENGINQSNVRSMLNT